MCIHQRALLANLIQVRKLRNKIIVCYINCFWYYFHPLCPGAALAQAWKMPWLTYYSGRSSLGIFLLHSSQFCVLKKEDCADGKHWNCMDVLLGCPRNEVGGHWWLWQQMPAWHYWHSYLRVVISICTHAYCQRQSQKKQPNYLRRGGDKRRKYTNILAISAEFWFVTLIAFNH